MAVLAEKVTQDSFAAFHPTLRRWFLDSFDAPTPAQTLAWPSIAAGNSTLLLAPTGSGKTLAAFLVAIDRIMFHPRDDAAEKGVRVLYISPLKALGVDVERNLRSPIAGVRAAAEREGVEHHLPTVGVRSGDTPSDDRLRLRREPPEILITTPESLYLMLTSRTREILKTVDTVIVDEIHSLVGTKRGAHLAVSLERLESLRRRDNEKKTVPPLQRIGLSATQRPLDEVARFLGGAEATANAEEAPVARPVEILEAGRETVQEPSAQRRMESRKRILRHLFRQNCHRASPVPLWRQSPPLSSGGSTWDRKMEERKTMDRGVKWTVRRRACAKETQPQRCAGRSLRTVQGRIAAAQPGRKMCRSLDAKGVDDKAAISASRPGRSSGRGSTLRRCD